MSLVLLKNLLFSKRSAAPARKAPQTPSPSPITQVGRAHIPPLPFEKHQGTSWVDTTSSVDLEAQGGSDGNSSTATECPKCSRKQPRVSFFSKITTAIRKSFKAIREFRPTPRMISDAIIGISDGMTVPFALTAGLSSLGTTRIVVLGGVAELVAGMISMGVGGALGAKAESYVVPPARWYRALVADTLKLVTRSSAEAVALVHDVLRPYGFDSEQRDTMAKKLTESTDRMVDYLVRFHHQEKKPDPSRPVACGIVIGLGYAFGGLIPLIPYFCVERHQVWKALWISVGIMVFALFVFGYFKTVLLAEKDQDKSTRKAILGGLEMVAIGGGAAAIAVGVVHGINSNIPE
ncbi:MAG: hypothetical protein Q9207_007633 [Kuettlingeria erythrocarpa]